ncbi:hypothetical protein ACFFGR_14815 [Arthrobacter liuii]|uniref:Uncharacterized protein n=1 Tax=Arthrobacter liuii TaxID=1476996 RepID=A0ABQ2AZP0_9MICC|nr:hypothetical protein [Arthrobacter liuii]GGH99301.1 hypothetical protein GCM10007170_33820 [Arthrobacter liuii]
MSTENTRTGDERPEDPSIAEDVIELSLLTAGETTGPVDTEWAQEHHNF